jgi:hypothetical protein
MRLVRIFGEHLVLNVCIRNIEIRKDSRIGS